MKFEQLLKIYWSKGFLYGGKLKSFDSNFKFFFNQLMGFKLYSEKKFLKRFEFIFLKKDRTISLIQLKLSTRKIINMYFSQIVNINTTVNNLVRFNIIRLYLIKSFRGKCQALGKPSRGQRTWSNASNAKQLNKVLRSFINEIKKNNKTKPTVESKNLKFIKLKKRKIIKFKVKIQKKKINTWF